MKVMVTGSKGQLGFDLARTIMESHETFALDRQQLDVSDAGAVMAKVQEISPDVIIHAAAYTKVDEAEQEPIMAFRTNSIGSRNIAIAAAVCGAKLVYISTDYVFDGKKGEPYCESDRPNPINVYGISKYAGELFVQSLHNRVFIVRTSWLYGGNHINHMNHFVRKIVLAAEHSQRIEVVMDEVGSPTYTLDLALFISCLMTTEQYGIYHASNQGSCSRYEFAIAILQEAGLDGVTVHPITTDQYRLPALRPKYSILDHQAIRSHGLVDLPSWRDALNRYMKGW
ncbi:MAG: dTDP-4-dehydrorhamnose reductase [Paenibacillaceae bacterium]